jgi:hypothetical protein
MNIDSAPGRACSAAYRAATCEDVNDVIDKFAENVRIFSIQHNITEAKATEMLTKNNDFDKWAFISPEPSDSNVGDTFTSNIPPTIVCASLKKDGVYNDTLAISISQDGTYNAATYKYSGLGLRHSGDTHTRYGLEHKIDNINEANKTIYIISAPWINGCKGPVNILYSTQPILEIRTENIEREGEEETSILKKMIIPHDYSKSNEKTACINAIIRYDKGKWTTTIERIFIEGYADDIPKLIEEIKTLENN